MPGTEYGPCSIECPHIDCAQTRQTAAKACGICQVRIGYDRRYYNDDEYGIVHAACLEDKIG